VGRKLTALFVARHREPGRYADSITPGLYLQITGSAGRSWLYRYQTDGRAHQIGLGPTRAVSLEQARNAAADLRRQHRLGTDPLKARRAEKLQHRAKAITFAECFDAYTAAHSASWKPKHAALWRSSMTQHALPVIGGLPVTVIDTAAVLRVLTPIWTTKPETAAKLRGRIEQILDQARVLGHRDGENPARWRGHLDKLLAAPGKVRRVEHRAAMPYVDIPEFMARLHAREGIDARALEFVILTAARTNEVLGARWIEFDLDNAVWTVPATRMKAGAEHRVPLSPAALEIVEAVKSDSDLVFPVGDQSGRAIYRELKRMGIGTTAHGFRSTFRDWAGESGIPREVAEAALAHVVGNKAERAYARSDLFERRRTLMKSWARYCAGSDPAVVPLRQTRQA
jgi:integrase